MHSIFILSNYQKFVNSGWKCIARKCKYDTRLSFNCFLLLVVHNNFFRAHDNIITYVCQFSALEMDMNTFDQKRYCIEKIREKNVHEFEEESTNGSLNAVPSTLKFTFDSGNFKIQEKKVEIMNCFLKPCPIRFSPLETDYFRFKNVYQVNKKNYVHNSLFNPLCFI